MLIDFLQFDSFISFKGERGIGKWGIGQASKFQGFRGFKVKGRVNDPAQATEA
jgi:hypothetical protein